MHRLTILTKQFHLRVILWQPFYPVTVPLHYCDKVLHYTMKCSAIQCKNFEGGHVATIVTTKGISMNEHKPKKHRFSAYISCLINKCMMYARSDYTQILLAICCNCPFKKIKKTYIHTYKHTHTQTHIPNARRKSSKLFS